MSLQLLDGTDSSVNLAVAVDGSTNTASMRCVINAMEYDSLRGFQNAEVLCTGRWAAELPGKNQDFIRVLKFGSKGSPISDLSPLMTATAAASLTATLQSGCTKTGTFWLGRDTLGVNAGQMAMPGQNEFRSYGAVATVWVTS